MVFSSGHYINMIADFGIFYTVIAIVYCQIFKEKKEFDPFDEVEQVEYISQEKLNKAMFCITGKGKEMMASQEKRLKAAGALFGLGFLMIYISVPYLYAIGMLGFITCSFLKNSKGIDVCQEMKTKTGFLYNLSQPLYNKR